MRVVALLLLLCRMAYFYCVPGDVNGSCARIKERQYQIRGVNVKPVWNHLLQGKEIRRKQSTNSRLNFEKENILHDDRPRAVKPKSLYNRDPIDSFERAVAGDEFDNRHPFEPIRVIKIEESNESNTSMKRKLATTDRINKISSQPNTQRIINSLSRKEPTHTSDLLKPQIIPFSSRDIAEHTPLLPDKIATKNTDLKENTIHEGSRDLSASDKGEVGTNLTSKRTHEFSGNASDLVGGKPLKMKTIDSTIIDKIQNESKPVENKTEQIMATTDLIEVEESTKKSTKSNIQDILYTEDIKENLNIDDEDQIDESLYFEDEDKKEDDNDEEKHKTKVGKIDKKQPAQKMQPMNKEEAEEKEEPEETNNEKKQKQIRPKNEENEGKEGAEEEGKEKIEKMKVGNIEESVDEEETTTKFKVGGDEAHIRSNMRAASLKDAPNAKYYYPPKDSVPLPSCFYNPSGIKTAKRHLQVRSEEMFHHPFESVVALSDFAQNVHFAGDLVCKVEIDGKYMITYATPYDAEHAVDNTAKGKKENMEEEKVSEKDSTMDSHGRKIIVVDNGTGVNVLVASFGTTSLNIRFGHHQI
uniref:Ground-like domain-containing protein n=1 Tax=Heterorhabditis bacteriophora TaxID=37862 RepID=A0A1I7XHK7_HETBA